LSIHLDQNITFNVYHAICGYRTRISTYNTVIGNLVYTLKPFITISFTISHATICPICTIILWFL